MFGITRNQIDTVRILGVSLPSATHMPTVTHSWNCSNVVIESRLVRKKVMKRSHMEGSFLIEGWAFRMIELNSIPHALRVLLWFWPGQLGSQWFKRKGGAWKNLPTHIISSNIHPGLLCTTSIYPHSTKWVSILKWYQHWYAPEWLVR